MKYYVTIGGRKFEWKHMVFKRQVGYESQTCSILIVPARGVTLPAFNDIISIDKEINGTTLNKWQGRVTTIQNIPLRDGTVKIIGYDFLRKASYIKVANLGYNNQKGSSILATEVAPYPTTDLTPGSISTTDQVLDTVNFGKNVSGGTDSAIDRSSAFQMIAAMSGRDVYIHRDGSVDLSGTGGSGTDRTTTHILEDGLNCNILPDIGYTEDETRRVKQVIVKGQGVGTNYVIGSAGTPAATDKVRQVEMAYIQSNAIANLIATSILNDLNQTHKYTKLELVDLFLTNYDIYDSVTLKARFPTKTVNQSMKIYSIETTVSNGLSDLHESVMLELSNFLRGVWAATVIKSEVADAVGKIENFNLVMTQAAISILPNIVAETLGTAAPADIGTVETYIEDVVFSSAPTVGCHVEMDLEITCKRESSTGILHLRLSDGTNSYPSSGNVKVTFEPFVGERTRQHVSFFISADIKSKDITLYGTVESSGLVEVIARDIYYTIGV